MREIALRAAAVYTYEEGVRMRASDRAYRALREEILDGVLAPGTALAEVE
jgi:DNA-binding GntR family transcriptional regulator